MTPPAAVPDPDALVAATLACPHVAAMSAGALGEIAVYLPGRRVRGIRFGSEGVAVHVVGVFGPSVAEILAQVRTAVAPLVQGQPFLVRVDDLADPLR